MSKMEQADLSLVIKFESKDYDPEDSEWQEECHKFYLQLKNTLDTGTIEPLRIEGKEKGHRGGDFLEMFNVLAAGIGSIGVVVELATLWLERRKGCEVNLKLPDGSEIKLSRARKEDILKLCEKYMAKQEG